MSAFPACRQRWFHAGGRRLFVRLMLENAPDDIFEGHRHFPSANPQMFHQARNTVIPKSPKNHRINKKGKTIGKEGITIDKTSHNGSSSPIFIPPFYSDFSINHLLSEYSTQFRCRQEG